MMAEEISTGKIFIFNRRTGSGLNVTGTSGSYCVEVIHLEKSKVST